MSRLEDISISKFIGASGASIVALVIALITYIDQYATKKDVMLSELNVSIRIMKIITIDYEYMIAAGHELSPIERNTYKKLTNDITRLQKERSELLNEN